MGNKIITEKDFWKCDTGAVPAQFQSTQKTVKKVSGEKYITVRDTSTSSWIDFGCTRLMLIYAIIAAAVVVIAAMTVATGGAALIALGALAGLAGAAWGAIVGTLLCGQIAAKARKWVGSKNDYIVQSVETITGDHIMTCPVGGIIKFAPEIKSWSQAVSLGFANYTGKLMEGMMAGAAIGMAGAAVAGGAGAFTSGGMRGVGQAAWQFAKSMPKNFVVNAIQSFGTFGLGLRGVMGAQNVAATYGNTGQASEADFWKGTVAMETGAWDSANLIYSDATGGVVLDENGNQKHAGWQDYVGMALMFSPVGQGKKDLENKFRSEPEGTTKDGEASSTKDTESKKAEEEGTTKVEAPNEQKSTIGDAAEAYTMKPISRETAIKLSLEASARADNNAKQLPSSQSGKTTASDGINTVSGHAENRISDKTRANMGGVTDVPPQDVINRSAEIDHQLNENSSIDNGVPGQASASHAEKQLMTDRPGDPIGVSREMCKNCKAFAQKQANNLGTEVVVTDPKATYVFIPGKTKPKVILR